MLEGQVAVLGCGVLSADEEADLVDALFSSALYRPDQRSFMLYPVRSRPSFLEKNVVPSHAVEANTLLCGLLAAGDHSLIGRDADGGYRFQAELTDARQLAAHLDRLGAEPRWSELVAAHRQETLDLYEQVFRHRSFIGRSGSMYAYEGIGSIYWHMVTKLLLAVQEAAVRAVGVGADAATVDRLVDAYWRVRSGLGANKTAREFGAIPTDPYSHTPAHAGAQQPGMTGAVKEELLARPLELGVRVDGGEMVFDPLLVRDEELLPEPCRWSFLGADGEPGACDLPAGSAGSTVCQVPVVVVRDGGPPGVEVGFADGRSMHLPGDRLDRATSAEVFARTGRVALIRATLPAPR
jgi:hypothetical protein